VLALRFPAGQITTYRAGLEQGRSVTWAGVESTKPAGFKDGHTGNHVELVFEQEVESVDAAGDAVARITIRTLTYLNRVHNNVTLDFDSARPEDRDSPLARLIGQTYRIRLSRKGDVLGITDIDAPRAAIAGDAPANQVAQRLLSDEEIRNRHGIPALMALEEEQVRPGQSWSDQKSFSFSSMGAKSFERVYTLGSVSHSDHGRLATVEMKAIPAAGQLQGRSMVGPFAGTTDSVDRYDGRLVLDLESGQVRECADQMRTEWVIVDPQSAQGETELAAVRMAAMQVRRLEQVR
jgi:hypothetical protein